MAGMTIQLPPGIWQHVGLNPTGILMLGSSIRQRLLHRGLRARLPLYRVPLTANHRRLSLQWVHEHTICRYAGERCLSECVIERHSDLAPRVMVWGAISYYERSNLLRIGAQHIQLFPWSAYSPDMLLIEHVKDLVGRRLARDPRPAASKDELMLCIQAIWNSLPQANIQNLFNSMPRRIAGLIAVRGGYTKY
ncbi:transposable element Tcb2 transposase [Trichonephila clavipes]|nr:transposable element Tcb2 transposase [Trichonephila clavipes]